MEDKKVSISQVIAIGGAFMGFHHRLQLCIRPGMHAVFHGFWSAEERGRRNYRTYSLCMVCQRHC